MQIILIIIYEKLFVNMLYFSKINYYNFILPIGKYNIYYIIYYKINIIVIQKRKYIFIPHWLFNIFIIFIGIKVSNRS